MSHSHFLKKTVISCPARINRAIIWTAKQRLKNGKVYKANHSLNSFESKIHLPALANNRWLSFIFGSKPVPSTRKNMNWAIKNKLIDKIHRFANLASDVSSVLIILNTPFIFNVTVHIMYIYYMH